jgi:hypothetical protein
MDPAGFEIARLMQHFNASGLPAAAPAVLRLNHEGQEE